MKIIILAFLVSLSKESLEQNPKYCDPGLCRLSRKHIACPGIATNVCPADAEEIVITDAFKRLILEKHNSYRNMLAGGNLTTFETAKNMPFMQWDDELAETARPNVMQCEMKHDECHNTKKFKWSGQNLAWSRGYKNDFDHINISIDRWWNENKDCTMDDIKKYGYSKKVIGHFTAMSQDRTDRVGCAAVRFAGNTRIMACNYGFTNFLDSYVYVTGAPTTGCKAGRHAVFKNLCHEKEVVQSLPF